MGRLGRFFEKIRRGDRDPRAKGIMMVLLDAFPVRPDYAYLKRLRQLPHLFFRDHAGGNAETLSRYRQWFRDILQEAEQDVAAVPLAIDLSSGEGG